MVELASMDATMVAQIELIEVALRPGTGSLTGPGTVATRAAVRRGGASRRDLGRRPL